MEPQKTASIIKTLSPNEKKKKEYKKKSQKAKHGVCGGKRRCRKYTKKGTFASIKGGGGRSNRKEQPITAATGAGGITQVKL